MSFEKILAELKKGVYHPVYCLTGEEPYYIDFIADYIIDHAVDEASRDFNLNIMYGRDSQPEAIIETAKRFPMMSERQVVVVREAQDLKQFEQLESYIANPLDTTVFVLCYKYKKLDKRKAFTKLLQKQSVYFESPKLYENKVPDWIIEHGKSKKLQIGVREAHLLASYLGSNLNRIVSEIDKVLLHSPDTKILTADLIQEAIGISKDFNTFELQDAIAVGDRFKAFSIGDYFGKNPRQHPLPVTVAVVYGFFSKLLAYHFLNNKTGNQAASALKINPYFLSTYQKAAAVYDVKKTVAIIDKIRITDKRSKGIGGAALAEGELLKELLYHILH